MKLALAFALLSLLLSPARSAEPAVPVPGSSATTDGRREVTVILQNPRSLPEEYRLPAGTVFQAEGGARMVTLREAATTLPPVGGAELTVPAASLTATLAAASSQAAQVLPEPAPKLAPLLKYLASQNDVPRGTSQCAVLALEQDLTFEQWQQFAVGAEGSPQAASDALIEALDAVGILRTVAPERTFRLATDPELKLRALRQPALRAKALQLFGMTIPGEVAAGQTPPDLGQLLHTKPGDNCPICRMRAQMQRPASDL